MESHPSAEELVKFVIAKEDLGHEEFRALQAHTEQCLECRRKTESLLAAFRAFKPSEEEVAWAWEVLRKAISEET